jgi:hypothetical protein
MATRTGPPNTAPDPVQVGQIPGLNWVIYIAWAPSQGSPTKPPIDARRVPRTVRQFVLDWLLKPGDLELPDARPVRR